VTVIYRKKEQSHLKEQAKPRFYEEELPKEAKQT
jgi:hypothetical protein